MKPTLTPDDKTRFDFILLNTPMKKKMKSVFDFLDQYNFIEEFKNNSENSARILVMITPQLAHENDSAVPSKGIIINENMFWGYRTCNLGVLYLLKNLEDFHPITDFLISEKVQNSKVFKTINHILGISIDSEHPEQYALIFFPALKWFYSHKTKHFYPTELLKEMEQCEKEIENVKWEDCIQKPGKYSRLRT